MREYIQIGVNGIITDDVAKLHNIVGGFQPVIRMARRIDNPLTPSGFSYGLSIHTGDMDMAGTDANVMFTLTGPNGSATVSVDTNLPYRMERNDWNYIILRSQDLGDLQSITVQSDNEGNAPDWYLDTIVVESSCYGVSKRANFNKWIDTTSHFTQPLVYVR